VQREALARVGGGWSPTGAHLEFLCDLCALCAFAVVFGSFPISSKLLTAEAIQTRFFISQPHAHSFMTLCIIYIGTLKRGREDSGFSLLAPYFFCRDS
jgi:hypothetical protein